MSLIFPSQNDPNLGLPPSTGETPKTSPKKPEPPPKGKSTSATSQGDSKLESDQMAFKTRVMAHLISFKESSSNFFAAFARVVTAFFSRNKETQVDLSTLQACQQHLKREPLFGNIYNDTLGALYPRYRIDSGGAPSQNAKGYAGIIRDCSGDTSPLPVLEIIHNAWVQEGSDSKKLNAFVNEMAPSLFTDYETTNPVRQEQLKEFLTNLIIAYPEIKAASDTLPKRAD